MQRLCKYEPSEVKGKVNSNQTDEVLTEIEEMSKRRFLPIVGPRRGKILVKVVRETKPKRILEIGTFIGYSAVLMGKELESDAQLTTIEINADEANLARKNIKNAQVPPTINVIVGDAVKVLPKISGNFDLVFIDADKKEYLKYLCLIENRLHKGSVVVADNAGIFAYQMKDYLKYVRYSERYRSEFVAVDEDGIEISVKL